MLNYNPNKDIGDDQTFNFLLDLAEHEQLDLFNKNTKQHGKEAGERYGTWG